MFAESSLLIVLLLTIGVNCADIEEYARDDKPLITELEREDDAAFRSHELLQAVKAGLRYARQLSRIEDKIIELGLTVKSHTTEGYHASQFGSDPVILNNSRNALIALHVGQQLIARRM